MLATRLRLCLIITVSLLSLLAVGCSRRADTDTGKPKIVLVMKSLANEFFKTMEEGATAHQRAHSDVYDLKVVGIRNEEDVAQQVDLVEMIIAQGADAIVIAPADSEALIPICKKAIAAGIVVVNIDNKLRPRFASKPKAFRSLCRPDNAGVSSPATTWQRSSKPR